MSKSKPSTSKRSRRAAKRSAASSAGRSALPMPVKLGKKKGREIEREEGPSGWFLPQIESTYTALEPTEAGRVGAGGPAAAAPMTTASFSSRVQPGAARPRLMRVAPTAWVDRLLEYKRRKARVAGPMAAPGGPVGAPIVPGGRNWLPLGPSVVLEGQTVGNESVGGRVVGLAIAPGAARVYAASACGGVFRSDDAGASWRSLMDGFDVDPTNFASASLACGAIAIDPAAPDRIYVGTGEGETHQLFQFRVVGALPAYRGIGPIRSDDGGTSWVSEATTAGSPPLAGEAFFALAVDPRDRDNVVAATTGGLYQRVVTGGTPHWTQRRPGVHSAVVVASAGATRRFFAAEWGKGVFQSSTGETWQAAGTGFPTAGVGRIALAVQATNPNIVYAAVSHATSGVLVGVYRLDGITAAWKKIANPPDVLPAPQGRSQGAYDLTVVLDPNDVNLLYLGGSYCDPPAPDPEWPWPASIWRARVTPSGPGWRFTSPASIGTHAHADVHVLALTPGDSDELWVGCDGGVFLNRNPSGTGQFAAQNTGLSCLCSNFIGQHPTDPSILFTGLQDNGTARSSGSPMWKHVNFGDGGYCVVNWANPSRVLSFVNGRVYRSNTGGDSHTSWSSLPVWNFGWATMTQPIVAAPYNPGSPADADVAAVGAGALVFVSTDFASSWPTSGRISLPGGTATGSVFALAFASPARLFVGTTAGRVFRVDRSGSTWTVTRLDDAAGGRIGVTGLISDIAVDWSDTTLASCYVCFAGMGDERRVWRFDGTAWESRSGSPGDNLLDVEHNALAVDSQAPQNVYVGADIGVWHSPDAGLTWSPFQNGLPDAPVFDLQIHPTQRLLRAATHGRGVYEIAL